MAAKIGAVMGEEVGDTVRMTAFVKCAGDCEKTTELYEYTGVSDCKMISQMQNGGAKSCSFGCLGSGSCVKVCPFDAVRIVNGIARWTRKNVSPVCAALLFVPRRQEM